MIRRVPLFLATSYLAVAILGAAWAPTASAAASRSRTTTMSVEAWYASAPACGALVDCSGGSVDTFPKDTLHVALSAGQEAARTYLAFAVPPRSRLTSAVLTLPIDTDAGDGSLSPDLAAVVACSSSTKFEAVRGSLAKQPAVSCAHSVRASYDERSATFTVSLAPFLSRWRSGRAAIALLPNPDARQPNETWHVVFPAHTKKGAHAVTVSLTYLQRPKPAPSPQPSPTSTPTTGGSGSGDGSTGGGGGGFTSGPFPQFTGGGGGLSPFPTTTTTTTTTTSIGGGDTTTDRTVLTAPPFLEGFAAPGFAYPLVWALPLVFLIAFTAAGRALTKDLYRRGV